MDTYAEMLKSARKMDSDFEITKDEEKRLGEAFKNEEFRKMFEDYMKEISDPKAREQHEAYIRQMEAENNVPKDSKLIRPKAFMSIYTETNHGKLVANIVTEADKSVVEMPTLSKDKSWAVPHLLGPIRQEMFQGETTPTFDCCFHESVRRYVRNGRFLQMVINITLEEINGQLKVHKSSLSIKDCSKYKINQETEHVSSVIPTMIVRKANLAKKTNDNNNNDTKNKKQKNNESGLKKMSKALKKVDKKEKQNKDEPTEPEYTVIHQNDYDMANSFQDTRLVRSTAPTSLLVKVELPGVASMKGVDLDVTHSTLTLKVGEKYFLDLRLHYRVDFDKARAKWRKKKSTLEVTLPLLPPKEQPVIHEKPPLIQEISSKKTKKTENKESEENKPEVQQSVENKPVVKQSEENKPEVKSSDVDNKSNNKENEMKKEENEKEPQVKEPETEKEKMLRAAKLASQRVKAIPTLKKKEDETKKVQEKEKQKKVEVLKEKVEVPKTMEKKDKTEVKESVPKNDNKKIPEKDDNIPPHKLRFQNRNISMVLEVTNVTNVESSVESDGSAHISATTKSGETRIFKMTVNGGFKTCRVRASSNINVVMGRLTSEKEHNFKIVDITNGEPEIKKSETETQKPAVDPDMPGLEPIKGQMENLRVSATPEEEKLEESEEEDEEQEPAQEEEVVHSLRPGGGFDISDDSVQTVKQNKRLAERARRRLRETFVDNKLGFGLD